VFVHYSQLLNGGFNALPFKRTYIFVNYVATSSNTLKQSCRHKSVTIVFCMVPYGPSFIEKLIFAGFNATEVLYCYTTMIVVYVCFTLWFMAHQHIKYLSGNQGSRHPLF